MKLEYWFELPASLSCLLEEDTLVEEQKQANHIETCFNNFKTRFQDFQTRFESNKALFLEIPERNQILLTIKEKLKNLHKEKAELACLSIKTALRIMKKLIEDLEKFNQNISNDLDNLSKIKLFLKITRITIDKVNEELKSCEGGERSLFLMLKVCVEKYQAKLFSYSQNLLRKFNVLNNDQYKDELNTITKRPILATENDINFSF